MVKRDDDEDEKNMIKKGMARGEGIQKMEER